MYDFNPTTRIIDIDSLISEYENILLEIGILTTLNKSFKNHMLVNKSPTPSAITSEIKLEKISPPKHKVLSSQLKVKELDNGEYFEIDVKCPENKEFNPFTKRCIKKCKNGYQRDKYFKCIKSNKKCDSNKILNPLTQRCVKQCSINHKRNKNFNCVSFSPRKTRKNKKIKTPNTI